MFNISNKILALATECEKKFSCLGSECDFCKVALCVENEVLFIKCKDRAPCPYKESFAYSFICTCPVRKELYDKYKI